METERDDKGFLHQKGRSCFLCKRLKDSKNNDGYVCKYASVCNEKNNYPKFIKNYKTNEVFGK